MYNKIFTSAELKLAIEKGYKVTKVHSFQQFEKYEGLMKQYVSFFLKIKIENNKHYTPEECEEINTVHKQMGFIFEIKSKILERILV